MWYVDKLILDNATGITCFVCLFVFLNLEILLNLSKKITHKSDIKISPVLFRKIIKMKWNS